MFLKLTSSDERTFELVSNVRFVRFSESNGAHVAHVRFADGTAESFEVPGSAFVLNEAGVTVERYVPGGQQQKEKHR